jgi:hypothetical protein
MIRRSFARTFSLHGRALQKYHSQFAAADAFVEKPSGSQFGLLAASLLSVTIFVGFGAWYFELSKPAVCEPSPLILPFGNDADLGMTVRSEMRCPVYVLPGSAVIDEPLVAVEPRHGSIAPRGHTGVYYRSEPGFKGDDYFAIALSGTVGPHPRMMAIRVTVTVK